MEPMARVELATCRTSGIFFTNSVPADKFSRVNSYVEIITIR